eukprot:5872746-Pyramimonas_sp.AAC.1
MQSAAGIVMQRPESSNARRRQRLVVPYSAWNETGGPAEFFDVYFARGQCQGLRERGQRRRSWHPGACRSRWNE